MSLARQAREPGWWTQYEDLNLSPYIGFEQDATAITAFSMYWVPALLQTAEYARAVITGIARKIEPAVLERRIGTPQAPATAGPGRTTPLPCAAR